MNLVNKKAIEKLQGTTKKKLQNFKEYGVKVSMAIGLAATLGLGMVEPIEAASYTVNYAYIPYNASWGEKEENHSISIQITKDGLGIVNKNNANKELLSAIYTSLGEEKVKSSKYNYITFQLSYETPNSIPVIKKDTFAFYKKKTALGPLTNINAWLPVTIFVAPDGQQWINEENYQAYVQDKKIVYQCKDGSLAYSYKELKAKENIVASNIPIPSMDLYQELSSDGTLWKDMTVLQEYLCWKANPNYGLQNGLYVGAYGTATSFEEYVKIYSTPYVLPSLTVEKQFFGAYGFLYSSLEKAQASLVAESGYQKVYKKTEINP